MENIFDFVRNAVDSNVPTLKEIFAGYNWERVDIKDIFSLNYKSTDTLIMMRDQRRSSENQQFLMQLTSPSFQIMKGIMLARFIKIIPKALQFGWLCNMPTLKFTL